MDQMLFVLVTCVAALSMHEPVPRPTVDQDAGLPAKVRVLILDGVNNHDWATTTRATKATLLATGRFLVDVSTSPAKDAGAEEWARWRPEFARYQVVLSNFNDGGACLWSEATKRAFVAFVRGGGGFVAVHAADNASADWPEYNAMIGVGGWGGRAPETHGALLRKVRGGWRADPAPDGRSGDHGARWSFPVRVERPDHPILAGLPAVWLHADDELYNSLRGPCENVTVLASARSKRTGVDEPVALLVEYGEGRVFHLPLGHVSGPEDLQAVHCVGFQTLLARGTEYAATGSVTLPVPPEFPTREAVRAVAPERVSWQGAR